MGFLPHTPSQAECSVKVWYLCADALATVITLLLGALLLALSWLSFYGKTSCLSGSSTSARALEAASALLAVAAYFVLVDTALQSAPLSVPTRAAVWITRQCLGRLRQAEADTLRCHRRSVDTRVPSANCSGDDEAPPAATAVMLASLTTTTNAVDDATGCAPPPRPVRARRSCILLVASALTVMIMHCVAHHVEPDHHRLSQELLVAIVRAVADTCVLALFVGAAAVRGLRRCVHVGLMKRRQLRHVSIGCAVLLVWAIMWCVSGTMARAWTLNTREHLSGLILGGHADACEAVGRKMNASVASATVWPAVLPRRAFNFFTGSTSCTPHGGLPPLAWVDSDQHVLVVSPVCWDGHDTPRVYVERPINNDLYRFRDEPHASTFNASVEARYGRATPERSGVAVHRDAKTQRITEVEVVPSRLRHVVRPLPPPGSPEAVVRARWPSPPSSAPASVLELPLGESVTYFVRCPRQDALYEEMYLYPKLNFTAPVASAPKLPASAAHGDAPTGDAAVGVTEPPGNVLMIIFDSTSRQEVLRSLPLFAAWLRDFKARQASKGSQGYLVVEPQHHTIVGTDTNGNAGALMTGSNRNEWNDRYAHGNRKKFDSTPFMFTNDAKQRYGDERIRTSLIHGMCEDLWGRVLTGRKGPGMGDRSDSTDHHVYTPFCHTDYGATFGILNGPFSIRRRCIDGRNVHHYLLDYTTYLMKQRVRRARRQSPRRGEFFFDITYFLDAHEPTHSVLYLVDRDLTDFMVHLEQEVGFFDNPLNSFVFAADHGSNMGYYSMNAAGRFEQTSPALVMAVHPEVLRRVDVMKGREAGTSARNLLARMLQFSSNLDTHMTLRDILGVPGMGVQLHKDVRVPPRSHFDRRDVVPQNCTDYRYTETCECSLSYCH